MSLLGVNIDNVPVDTVLDFVDDAIEKKKKSVLGYANIHALNLAYQSESFRAFFNSCQIVYCDGVGVKIGAWITGQELAYRFTPPDWIDLLCQRAAKNGTRLFFLGSQPGVAKQAGETLSARHEGLSVSSHHGYFDHFGPGNNQVINDIHTSGAAVVMVGMGMPLQERWITHNADKLPHAYVFIPVGAMFDYVAGVIPRGPRWLTDHGFEWLIRLLIEPKRLWHRYLIGNPLFFIRLLRSHRTLKKSI